MTHKVLVLCQRRVGKDENELKLINDSINELSTQLVGDDTEIKYLTTLRFGRDMYKGSADFIGEFGDNEWTRENFIKQSYSLIICNTCPFHLMKYAIINEYLQDGGLLALTAFTKNGPSSLSDILENPMFKSAISSKGFEQRDDINNAVIFQKVSAPTGGKINKKYRKTRKVKRSRKFRKSRKFKRGRRSRN